MKLHRGRTKHHNNPNIGIKLQPSFPTRAPQNIVVVLQENVQQKKKKKKSDTFDEFNKSLESHEKVNLK
jgi:hypothetical protein